MVPIVLHNFRVSRIARDFFLNDIFRDRMGGTPVFGRFAALLPAAILSHARWMPLPATFFSIALVLAGLFFWPRILTMPRRSNPPRSSFTLGVTEPFVGMAERFRFEPFSFLLMALAFWLASLR